jgi:hypothetical protein
VLSEYVAAIVNILFATPRKLPKPRDVVGRAVVLDIAFASEAGGSGFEKVTMPFISGLGARLAAWIDHHDSDHHARFANDARFVLRTKQEHGACPEMVTADLVERVGPVDTIVCHNDFDGLASAAKWIRKGIEPYPGCDNDARAIDTRLFEPGAIGIRFDRAIRARSRDTHLFDVIVRHLATGLEAPSLWEPIDKAADELGVIELETRALATRFRNLAAGRVAYVDVSGNKLKYDKTMLLLLGQERARIAIVLDDDVLTMAAPFDSGENFLQLLGLSGGMPTRVSTKRGELHAVLKKLGARTDELPPI